MKMTPDLTVKTRRTVRLRALMKAPRPPRRVCVPFHDRPINRGIGAGLMDLPRHIRDETPRAKVLCGVVGSALALCPGRVPAKEATRREKRIERRRGEKRREEERREEERRGDARSGEERRGEGKETLFRLECVSSTHTYESLLPCYYQQYTLRH